MEREQRVPARRLAVVHPARRVAAALGPGRAHVRGARQVAVLAAGRADALQHRCLCAVRGHLGLQRGHCGHRGHGGAAAGAALRLLGAVVSRHAGRRRNARHPDPAVDQHDHLRGAHQHLGAEAVSGRHHSGAVAEPGVHGGGADRMLDSARVGWPAAARLAGVVLRVAGAPGAAAGHLPRRGRLDLRWHRHADRGRIAGGGGRPRPGRGEPRAQLADAARGAARHDEVHRDDHVHRGRRRTS